MIREKRLLERLATKETEAVSRSTNADVFHLVNSVMEHLKRILNTRQGSVPMDPEFGVPNFSELPGNFSSPETDKIKTTLEEMIKRYEPRLAEVSITFEGTTSDALGLQFRVSAVIYYLKHRVPLNVSTRMSANSTFQLSPMP